MSEQMNLPQSQTYRRQLLGTASTIALVIYIGGAPAKASDRPVLWIEGGWHSEQVTGKDQLFEPSFVGALTDIGFPSPVRLEYPTPYSFGAEGNISLQPEGSSWVFSVAARYGRLNGGKQEHFQTSPAPVPFHQPPTGGLAYYTPLVKAFSDSKSSNAETHAIVDFLVGRDVGLGLISDHTTSVVNLGVRYAQFHSKSTNTLKGDEGFDIHFKYVPFVHGSFPSSITYQLDNASEQSSRSFRGVGPAIGWSASTPVFGNSEDGEMTIDWGMNAAVLFGRQKANVQHQTTVTHYNRHFFSVSPVVDHNTPPPQSRSRNVTVPNLGGFAGISYQFTNAKLSAGYRADYFFGAMDSGIDVHKSRNIGFFGPFATVSIGLP